MKTNKTQHTQTLATQDTDPRQTKHNTETLVTQDTERRTHKTQHTQRHWQHRTHKTQNEDKQNIAQHRKLKR